MILKEAFRYQNYLSSLFTETVGYLSREDFITTTTQNHNRKKSNPDADDEKVVVQKPYNVEFKPNDLIDFAVKLIDEKQKLSDAITEAKKTTSFDVDAAMSMNKTKQGFIHVLRRMASIKPTESEREGVSYKFNNDGDQVSYRYPIKEIKTIDYNREDVKKLIDKYKKETDEISTERDRIDIMTEVNYKPIWEVDTPLEDIIEDLTKQK